MGAGSDVLPGLAYQPNNGMPGGTNQVGNFTPVPCNTNPVNNFNGRGTYPDANGCDPTCGVQEFWSRGGGAQG